MCHSACTTSVVTTSKHVNSVMLLSVRLAQQSRMLLHINWHYDNLLLTDCRKRRRSTTDLLVTARLTRSQYLTQRRKLKDAKFSDEQADAILECFEAVAADVDNRSSRAASTKPIKRRRTPISAPFLALISLASALYSKRDVLMYHFDLGFSGCVALLSATLAVALWSKDSVIDMCCCLCLIYVVFLFVL